MSEKIELHQLSVVSQSASEFVSCVFWSEEIETDDEMKSSSEKWYMYDTYYVETAVYKNPHGMHNTLHTLHILWGIEMGVEKNWCLCIVKMIMMSF